MLASILIATFNRDNLLDLNLASLCRQNLKKDDFEVIIINDGLESAETEKLVKKYERLLNIKYIFSGKRNSLEKKIWRNPGFAYNYGAQFSSGKYLFICGAEIFHENSTIMLMLSEIRSDENTMVIPTGMDDRDGSYTQNILSRGSAKIKPKLFELNTKLPFLMCIKREYFFQINGYDEDMIGIGYDDDDIVNRFEKIGLKYKVSKAKITHLFHKRTPENYVQRGTQDPKILHDKLVYFNNQIYESKKYGDPVRNNGRSWGSNNIWYLNNIPKKIHFYWGHPHDYISYLRFLSIFSAKQKNPDFEIYLHMPIKSSSNEIKWRTSEQTIDERSAHNWFHELKKLGVIIKRHDFEKCGFSNDRHEVHKSDFLRWIILFEFGGFWSDIDIFYSKSLYDSPFNIPENYNVDTGIHIYPDFRSHAIGFLFSSVGNKLFKSCHNLCSNKFKNITDEKYQSFGSDILNNNFKTIDSIRSTLPSLNIINIDKECVYRVSPTENDIASLYSPGSFEERKKEIGIHWFGGHPASKKFEKEFEVFNKDSFNSKLSKYIIKNIDDSEYADSHTKEVNVLNPKISFVIFGLEKNLIDSILLNFLNQNNKSFEIVLVTRSDIEINESIKNSLNIKHIRIIRDESVHYMAAIGCENSSCEYVCFMSTSIVLSEKYMETIQFEIEKNAKLFAADELERGLSHNFQFQEICSGKILIKKEYFENKSFLNLEESFRMILLSENICFFKNNIIKNVGTESE